MSPVASATPRPVDRAGPLEVWGGIECTVNRVGDGYFDQIERSGHAQRDDDLDRFAALGIRAIRYPVLWERMCASAADTPSDWRWVDRRLARINALGLRPIVGLLHHGSGPRDTSLIDPRFPERFAAYARAVAERLPWVMDYTPVNEPLTTARFAALYGHWYPHASTSRAFARACMNQYKATVLAMREIRAVNPAARLVQTEDLGRTFSTKKLRYQANFENGRRWLTFDALTGALAPGHRLYRYFLASGIKKGELEWLADNACAPDVIGINHYLTSERYLDERARRYPRHTRGGNGRDRYADVEAVRVIEHPESGVRARLDEAWRRYRTPIAITEAHLGCTREEQLRWLRDVWTAASDARADGVDIRAVTAWSLLGAFDWPSLLTRNEGCYESGVFDVRAPTPRPTALAAMVHDLATRGAHDHPVLGGAGWWRTERRFLYPPRESTPAARGAPVAIVGGRGTLGRAFARACQSRGLAYRAYSRRECDAANPESVRAVLDRDRPWCVINAAGFVRVDDAEHEQAACVRDNVTAAETLATECAARGIRFVSFSSDLVFDGALGRAYVERDAVAPLGVYGESKARAEHAITAATDGEGLVVRTSAFFGNADEHNFVTRTLRDLFAGRVVRVADDLVVSPTFVPDLADVTLDLAIDGERGIWHLANRGAVTWLELAEQAATLAGADCGLLAGVEAASLGLTAARPRYSALASERGDVMPPLADALARYVARLSPAERAPADEAPRDEPALAGAL